MIRKCLKLKSALKFRKEIPKTLQDVEEKQLVNKKPTLVFKYISNDYNTDDFTADLLEQNEYLEFGSENTDRTSFINVKL